MEFISNFLAVAEKVGLLFILIAVGFVCQKLKVFSEESNRSMADLVMYFVTPCVIINAFSATAYEKEELLSILKNIGIVALVAVIAHTAMILIAHFVFRFKEEDRRKVMRFGAVFSNAGFFGLPMAQAIVDTDTCREGSLYAAIYLAIFNSTLWTYGLLAMSREEKALSFKRLALNPGIIGVVVGMFFFTSPLFFHIGGSAGVRLPQVIMEALEVISALNLPIPMFMVGFYLAKADLIAAFKDKWAYLCIALRLVVFPMLALGIVYFCGVRGNVLVTLTISSSAPQS